MIKSKIIVILSGLLLILGGYLYFQNNRLDEIKSELKTANKRISAEVNKNQVYDITIEELKSSKDSSDLKVDSLIKKLKIKPSKVVSTVYVESGFSKTDTIQLKDTVNKDLNIKIGDKWYALDLQLKYPNQLVSNIKIRNELVAIVYDKRETVKPRKKFFIARWFQKKQTVQVIEVTELNPYSECSNFKFIKIIK